MIVVIVLTTEKQAKVACRCSGTKDEVDSHVENVCLMEKLSPNQPSMLEGWFGERGNLPGGCPDPKFVVIEVGELGPFAPGFRAQLSGQSDPTTFERFTGCVNVVRVQDIAGPAGFVAPIWPRRPSMMWVCAPGGVTSSQRSVALMG